MTNSPQRPTMSKKFEGSFQYKTKYNITCFSHENVKNYKDMIMNSKLGELYFYCKKMYVANDLVRHCNSVTHQKSEKERLAHFFIVKTT